MSDTRDCHPQLQDPAQTREDRPRTRRDLAGLTGMSDRIEQAGAASSLGRVAIVHDYLNQRGGAEKVVLEMSDIWPDAPIYTSLYRPDSTFAEFRGRDIRTSFLDRLPVDRGFRNLFPLYPAAFWSFGEIDADVVIASSSGWAHMARAVGGAIHVIYCHTPARWLYRDDYLASGRRTARRQAVIAPFGRGLRRVPDELAHARRRLLVSVAPTTAGEVVVDLEELGRGRIENADFLVHGGQLLQGELLERLSRRPHVDDSKPFVCPRDPVEQLFR